MAELNGGGMYYSVGGKERGNTVKNRRNNAMKKGGGGGDGDMVMGWIRRRSARGTVEYGPWNVGDERAGSPVQKRVNQGGTKIAPQIEPAVAK